MANTTYRVSGTLKHNGETFADGSSFSTDDPLVEAQLRRAGTLLTQEEYARDNPEALLALSQEREELAARTAALEARLRELEADKSSQGSSDGAAEDSSAGESATDDNGGC